MLKHLLHAILLVFFALTCEAKIIETTTIEEIVPLIDDQSWLILDLDNTVFEGRQALGHTDWFYDKAHALMREKGMTIEDATRECYPEWIEVQKICPVKPVEAAFLPALVPFQEKGVVIMGLTHRQPSITDSTLNQLKMLNWSFVPTAPEKTTLVVPSATPTLYKEGVLFTGEYNKKGEIFLRFLSMIGLQPKKIIFVDDKKNHVEDMEKAVTSQGIEYTGVHYRATEHVKKVYDPEIAEFQKGFMTKILSNEAALLLMENGIYE